MSKRKRVTHLVAYAQRPKDYTWRGHQWRSDLTFRHNQSKMQLVALVAALVALSLAPAHALFKEEAGLLDWFAQCARTDHTRTRPHSPLLSCSLVLARCHLIAVSFPSTGGSRMWALLHTQAWALRPRFLLRTTVSLPRSTTQPARLVSGETVCLCVCVSMCSHPLVSAWRKELRPGETIQHMFQADDGEEAHLRAPKPPLFQTQTLSLTLMLTRTHTHTHTQMS
jgi:hypothetical protein